MDSKEIFTKIKDGNIWGSHESRSGPGSETKQTETLRAELSKLLKEKNITSMLDIPCGDFNWMREVDLSGIDYIGGDIVDELTYENTQQYGRDNFRFKTMNLITDPLPACDLIFVRDCFVHLPYSDIFAAIKNIKSSGSKYLLTTTFINHHENHDIPTGWWRALNLRDEPFNLPEPERVIIEKSTEWRGKQADKAMGLWRIDAI